MAIADLFQRPRVRDPINLPAPRFGVRRFVPRTLFARALLIILIPLFLMQAIAVGYFFDTHWNRMTDRLAIGVVGELQMARELHGEARSERDRQRVFNRASRITGVVYSFDPGGSLTPVDPPDSFALNKLQERLTERFGDDYTLTRESEKWLRIELAQPEGVLIALVPMYRMFSQTGFIFLLYLVGSALILFSIALIFMRNQIRPIRRLAKAADGFGKGRDPVDFRLEGATEVRQAGRAFLLMRERLKRMIGQRTDMLAGVSHDLRTPLTRMKLTLAFLEGQPEADNLKADVADMEAMIEGYLAFARGEAAERSVEVDIARLVADAVADATREGAAVTADIAPDLPPLMLKQGGVKRMLANLIGNARRYGGAVWVTVRHRGTAVEILIEDDGPGIPEDELEAVFKPFYRLESSRNLATGGSGLGLTIARDIARDHGGDVLLGRSRGHGGLAAMVRLPL